MRKIGWMIGCLCLLLFSAIQQTGNKPVVQAQSLPAVEINPTSSLLTYYMYLPVIMQTLADEMAKVSSGWFWMGCKPDENAGIICESDEVPLHEVYLSDFWMDKTEVTNASYAQCVTASACTPPASVNSYSHFPYYTDSAFAKFPVINVTWNDAQTFCSWAGKRLPTEAEWEKAARGWVDTRLYPWGDAEPSCSTANIGDCVGDTSQVGSYPSGDSMYGIHDLIGNALEWVNDWYSWDYYESSPNVNPQGPDTGTSRVQRGGTYYFPATIPYLRLVFRLYEDPTNWADDTGFRCASSHP